MLAENRAACPVIPGSGSRRDASGTYAAISLAGWALLGRSVGVREPCNVRPRAETFACESPVAQKIELFRLTFSLMLATASFVKSRSFKAIPGLLASAR